MDTRVSELVALLDIEGLDDNLFRGRHLALDQRHVYGGQVVAQALVAAARTVDGRVPHSLHAYFLRGGDWERPILYEVDRIRDGGSFSARRVQAVQHGVPILSMIASFQKQEPGLEHQFPMPSVPDPDGLPLFTEPRQDSGAAPVSGSAPDGGRPLSRWPLLVKPTRPGLFLTESPREPSESFWIKADGPLPDDPMMHLAVLAYASDFNLLSAALLPHGKPIGVHDMIVASIDHAVWFHRAARLDDWLLYATDAPTSQGARGFSRGSLFDRAGRLVASTAQESLIRDLTLGVRRP